MQMETINGKAQRLKIRVSYLAPHDQKCLWTTRQEYLVLFCENLLTILVARFLKKLKNT